MGSPRLGRMCLRAMMQRWRWKGAETENLPRAHHPGTEDMPGENCFVCVCVCVCVFVYMYMHECACVSVCVCINNQQSSIIPEL